MPIPYELTAADIMDLRVWRKSAGSLPDGLPLHMYDVAFMVVAPSDGTLCLHSQGKCVAAGLRAEVMCALLYMERLEPGYCASVCDPAITIEEALRTPAMRLEARRAAAARAAADREAQRADDLRAARRMSQLHHDPSLSTLTFEDLFSTP